MIYFAQVHSYSVDDQHSKERKTDDFAILKTNWNLDLVVALGCYRVVSLRRVLLCWTQASTQAFSSRWLDSTCCEMSWRHEISCQVVWARRELYSATNDPETANDPRP